MTIYDTPIGSLQGDALDLHDFEDKAVLVVNVASRCGLTPQYSGLESLQRRYADRGFTVLGVPCNQFGGQEPGSAEEIASFLFHHLRGELSHDRESRCQRTGPSSPYAQLTEVADPEGSAGDIQWNFEKFLVAPGGRPIACFRPYDRAGRTRGCGAIKAVLPG